MLSRAEDGIHRLRRRRTRDILLGKKNMEKHQNAKDREDDLFVVERKEEEMKHYDQLPFVVPLLVRVTGPRNPGAVALPSPIASAVVSVPA